MAVIVSRAGAKAEDTIYGYRLKGFMSEELLGTSETPPITRIQSGFQDVAFPFYR